MASSVDVGFWETNTTSETTRHILTIHWAWEIPEDRGHPAIINIRQHPLGVRRKRGALHYSGSPGRRLKGEGESRIAASSFPTRLGVYTLTTWGGLPGVSLSSKGHGSGES
ncbi:hypothetical protein E2C01_005748 [Portunus trituberculatus]|uniref:Uncharacterized protein n=1 Tax=Portunus trituberculatus TaxID=210409 RepID=A0A5B7CU86_PORTR|nr:hypothetical protein [Portunus trituberculatus]